MNVVEFMIAHANGRPSHPAVEDGNRIFSYALLTAMINHVAGALRARNIRRGDIVVVSLPDCAEHVATLMALAWIGAVSVSVDSRLSDVECRKDVNGLKIRAAIVANDPARFLDLTAYPLAALFDRFDPGIITAPGTVENLDPDSPLMITQSSGTTGEPKRLVLTHRQMAERNRRSLAALGLTAAERYLQVPRLSFFSGRRRCFKMLMLGATVVINRANSATEYADYFSDHRITYTFLTPYHLRALIAEINSDTPVWPGLKIIMGTAPSGPTDRNLARQRLTPLIFDTYGTNEVGTATVSTPEDLARYPDSIGRLIDGIEAQVVDDNDEPLPLGQIGQIGFRGPYFPKEYLDNPEATARHFRQGWIYPGDLAVINDEGYVFLKGRADDVINNSGVKYFPSEVETVLSAHPAVAEVAVIGGPHPKYGEVSVAYVVRSGSVDQNELFRFCEGKIAMFKAPQRFLFVKEIPKVPPGKPDRKALREQLRRALEGATAAKPNIKPL